MHIEDAIFISDSMCPHYAQVKRTCTTVVPEIEEIVEGEEGQEGRKGQDGEGGERDGGQGIQGGSRKRQKISTNRMIHQYINL